MQRVIREYVSTQDDENEIRNLKDSIEYNKALREGRIEDAEDIRQRMRNNIRG